MSPDFYDINTFISGTMYYTVSFIVMYDLKES